LTGSYRKATLPKRRTNPLLSRYPHTNPPPIRSSSVEDSTPQIHSVQTCESCIPVGIQLHLLDIVCVQKLATRLKRIPSYQVSAAEKTRSPSEQTLHIALATTQPKNLSRSISIPHPTLSLPKRRPELRLLTLQNPPLSKPQRLNNPRRQHHQNPNRDNRADDRVVFHETFDAVDLADDFLVRFPEGDSHRSGCFDGFLEGLEDCLGEVLF
jgi:hypothetical protein